MDSITTKICSKCGVTKLKSDFSANKRIADGLGRNCRSCESNRRKELYQSDPERYRARNVRYFKTPHGVQVRKINSKRQSLRKRYGLTESMWELMFSFQNGLCAICQTRPAKSVDHDHDTETVRGLLCDQCNFGLGNFKDNPTLLQRAIDYLDETKMYE